MAEKFKILSVGGSGKGLNIFKSSAYKEHEKKPMASLFWSIRWTIGIWLVCAMAFCLSFIFEHIWRYGWSPATAHWTQIYLQHMFSTMGLSVMAEIPDWFIRTVLRTDIMCIIPLFPIIAFYMMADATITKEFNPYGNDKFSEKSSNKATKEDIEKMGLFKGFMMVLGYFKGKPLMMPETLSALCLAPPGTGKTAGVVIPTILDCDVSSMIINDPKPELKQITSAYRATIGPVFIMNWAGQDDPENGIYYPSWNPLSPEHIPFNQEQRDLYVDSMCKILVQESKNDPHWSNTGRAGLAGMIQFMVSKIEHARADDYFYARLDSGTFDAEDAAVLQEYYQQMSFSGNSNAYAAMAQLQDGKLNTVNYLHIGTWANIPQRWLGKEASLSLILDWLTETQLQLAAELEERRRQGDQTVMMADPMRDVLENAVNEARVYDYSRRAIQELTQLANTPGQERGSIISTIMAGLAIFRNAAVRNRTSHSDFHFADLRGMLDPRDGKIKPVTVYLSINMVDAQALNPITGIFIELMSNFLLANAPDKIGTTGEKMGPYPVLFVLDEMPKMQKLDAVIQGPDLGRGQKISYLIIGQDIHQIQERYGADAASTIISTTAAKIVLRQNDPTTAKTFSDMMGYKMKITTVKGADGKDKDETKEELLYTPMDIMKLAKGKQIVIFQGYYNRPIEADQELHFLGKNDVQKKLAAKIAMGESAPMPEFLIPSHFSALGYTGTPKVYDPTTKEIKILDTVTQ